MRTVQLTVADANANYISTVRLTSSHNIAPQIQFTGDDGDVRPGGEGETMVRGLQATREGVDAKLQRSQIRLFTVRRPSPPACAPFQA